MKRREFIKFSTLLGSGAVVSPALMLGGCTSPPSRSAGAHVTLASG